MPLNRRTVRNKSRRKNKNPRPRRYRKIAASAGGVERELTRVDMKTWREPLMPPGNFRRMGRLGKMARQSDRRTCQSSSIPRRNWKRQFNATSIFSSSHQSLMSVSTVSVESKRLTSPRPNFSVARALDWSASHSRFTWRKMMDCSFWIISFVVTLRTVASKRNCT